MSMQAVRGMRDLLPEHTPYWRHLEQILVTLAGAYGYREIRFPIVEHTALFQRGIGDATDIVEKEMYTFLDRNGGSLSLRPEGTASCLRASMEHGLLYNQTQKLWYMGPMFRHERPQRGRYRQFHHFGVEAYGLSGADIEAEILYLTANIWEQLGLQSAVHLEINSLGTPSARQAYRDHLVNYFSANLDALDADSHRRLQTNPLRILDSKNPEMQELIAQAPVLTEHLDEQSANQLRQVCDWLDARHLPYTVNPRLVRGLDYYGGLVFEWITTELGAQSAVCAGGRYDGLVATLGGKSTPAIGFALGLDRVVELLLDRIRLVDQPDAYLILVGTEAEHQGILLAETWRRQLPKFKLLVNGGGGSFKNQFKRADKSGAALALILGSDEMVAGTVSVKFLRTDRPQAIVPQTDITHFLEAQQYD